MGGGRGGVGGGRGGILLRRQAGQLVATAQRRGLGQQFAQVGKLPAAVAHAGLKAQESTFSAPRSATRAAVRAARTPPRYPARRQCTSSPGRSGRRCGAARTPP